MTPAILLICVYKYIYFFTNISIPHIENTFSFVQVLQSLKSKTLDLACTLQRYIHCNMTVSNNNQPTPLGADQLGWIAGLNAARLMPPTPSSHGSPLKVWRGFYDSCKRALSGRSHTGAPLVQLMNVLNEVASVNLNTACLPLSAAHKLALLLASISVMWRDRDKNGGGGGGFPPPFL